MSQQVLSQPKTIRCAIYTRKSTTEGLDQDFTSLDAQRESAENYIASQRHEGWVALSTLYDDGGYTGANQKMMDEGTKVLWPERWTYYELMVVREEEPISFSSELQNGPINSKDCTFDVEGFTYWDSEYRSVDELIKSLGDDVEYYGSCDPGLGQDKMRGDYTAIIVLAKDTKNKLLYVLFADIQRYTPTETMDAIFAYYSRFPFQKFAIETNQFQELFAQEVERRGRELGKYLNIEKVPHTSDKMRRIQWLQPWLKNGTIRLSKTHVTLLEQARFHPRGKYDDGLDALEMAVRIAEVGTEFRGLIPLFATDVDPEDDVNWRPITDIWDIFR